MDGALHRPDTYRADIDGLRAVAVLSVIGFHAFWWRVPGGFVGVDIFFVISGFLITGIIARGHRTRQFSYRAFYARRVRRILPALLVVLASVWIAGWFTLLPSDFLQLGRHVLGGATFTSNVVLRGEAGYFDNAARSKPLLHLWSLAIEEQFYIFWPLVLGLAIRWRASLLATGVIAIASFAYCVATLALEPSLSFYSPFSRFWELMVGGLLAQGMHQRPQWFARYGGARSIVGFALILVAVFAFRGEDPFPGWRALLPTLGAFLIISAGPQATLNRYALSARPVVWVGSISYPLYLWHWPLLVFALNTRDDVSTALRAGVVAAGFVLAWLTMRVVEIPVRTSRNFGSLPLGLVALLVAVGVAGYATVASDGFVHRMGARGEYAASFDDTLPRMRYRTEHGVDAAFREECNFYDFDAWRQGRASNVPRPAIDATCYTPATTATHTVLLWGDSHAQHLNAGLRAALPDDVALLQVASSACYADSEDTDTRVPLYCRVSNTFAMDTIRRVQPDVVVVAQRFEHDLPRFRRVAIALAQAGVHRVVVVGPIPQWNPDLYREIALKYWDQTPDRLTTGLASSIVDLDRTLKAGLTADEPFQFVDLFDALCNAQGCRTYLDGDRVDGLMTFDYGHLTPRASRFVGRTLLAPLVMQAIGTASPAARTPTLQNSPTRAAASAQGT